MAIPLFSFQISFLRVYTAIYTKKQSLHFFELLFFCFFRSAVQFFTIPRLFFLEFLPKLDRPLQTVPVYETSCCVPITTFPLGSCLFPLPPFREPRAKTKNNLTHSFAEWKGKCKAASAQALFPSSLALTPPSNAEPTTPLRAKYTRGIMQTTFRAFTSPLLLNNYSLL